MDMIFDNRGMIRKYSAVVFVSGFLFLNFFGIHESYAQGVGGQITVPGDVKVGGAVGPTTPKAVGGNPNAGKSFKIPNPLGVSSITELIKKIAEALQIIAIPIAAGMILYGAYKIMVSAGDPKKFEEGKWIILYAALGYAIILVGSGFVYVIQDFFKK